MNAAKVQQWMEANSVRQLTRMPGTGDYRVVLRCEGHAGFGETVADALKQARELNAEFLRAAA